MAIACSSARRRRWLPNWSSPSASCGCPSLLAQWRTYALILVDELGYLPFSQTAAELFFQFFSDRYERASVGLTTNLDFAHWMEVFGHEQMTAALLDRLVHRSHILLLQGDSYRFRQSPQRQTGERPPAGHDGQPVGAVADC